MDTLYINHKNACLTIHQGRLVVGQADASQTFSLELLKRVVIGTTVDLNSSVIHCLVAKGVSLHFQSSRLNTTPVSVIAEPVANVCRRQGQYCCIANKELSFRLARALVRYKLTRQSLWLKSINQAELSEKMSAILTSLNQISPDKGLLLNLEGQGAKQVYRAMQLILPASLEFTGRNRRPPLDPVNALLSLGATGLYQQAILSLCSRGLDCYAGVFHTPCHGRASLACDLTDCFRPELEAFVVDLFIRNIINKSHFSWRKKVECVLNREGQRIWYPLWYRFSKQVEKKMGVTALKWALGAEGWVGSPH
ncbi:CRISPR-associated endonuclease Cas1 [Endozoicomonas gorgoniicola]|uniref:CRISPR-associated endonuclease Cas1 n=1 Tax=Endozoicomonas gorgoniicola TaxID=1234144 RepID=A0ABT3MSB8_9GAMM|nr:CRISPR-associated endonuclease Cas1 [Endozoicomonas gorgoniicola]MCW7552276.1 CRISPR-associated endonuclease Cas1 [Endozoicomonas gorgoniicola]